MSEVSLKQKIGEDVTEFFMIKEIEVLTKKSDNMPYLKLELGYTHGRIWANIWENTQTFQAEYKSGDIVKIQGRIEEYRTITQINIKKIRQSVQSDDVHPENFLPAYPGDLKELNKRLKNVIKNIKNKQIKELCTSILLEGDFAEKYSKAPAGKLWHHGYVGGLLEHSLTVAGICDSLADIYPQVNRDLLNAGGLLHDIGKVETYLITPYIEYSDEGRLLGHIVIGYERIKKEIGKIKDFPKELAMHLLHLILSHQGKLENASPVVPMTLESVILYQADVIDSKMNAYQRIINEQKTPDKKWSNYVNLIDRFIYFGDADNENK